MASVNLKDHHLRREISVSGKLWRQFYRAAICPLVCTYRCVFLKAWHISALLSLHRDHPRGSAAGGCWVEKNCANLCVCVCVCVGGGGRIPHGLGALSWFIQNAGAGGPLSSRNRLRSHRVSHGGLTFHQPRVEGRAGPPWLPVRPPPPFHSSSWPPLRLPLRRRRRKKRHIYVFSARGGGYKTA